MNTIENKLEKRTEDRKRKSVVKPFANVISMEDGFLIEMALPGISKDDIDLTIKDKMLTVESNRDEDNNDVRYNRREFDYTNFRRVFTLPEDIDQENIGASLENGLLKIKLVKRPEVMPKKISIK